MVPRGFPVPGPLFILGEDMKEKIQSIEKEALENLEASHDLKELENFKNNYLSKKGKVSSLFSELKNVPPDEKGLVGKLLNDLRTSLTTKYEERKKEEEKKALDLKLKEDKLDLTLPPVNFKLGSINPFYLIIDEMSEIFTSLGFKIDEGSDIETDKYNFELLNIPHDHPSRDMQDTFYLNAEKLLRTQTSAGQAHEMEDKIEKGPIRMICPGKCYRRDDDDMTHSHQFGQIEGLVVDKNITLSDLKGTLTLFVKKMFGEKRRIRLRSSYFPFTEPSVEVDVSCSKCDGKGCAMCKGTGWIEILGAGEVHPNVLRMGGYDPEVYQGFAFGIGIERVAMLRYGIDDIRRFYQNDLRWLKDFKTR